MPNTRISRKSQITIPADLRRSVGIELGDEVVVREEDGRIVITKAEPAAWLEQMAVLRGDMWNDAAETLRRERDEWDQRD
jgi:AbrB family looped-hinge helix DNA binding protein